MKEIAKSVLLIGCFIVIFFCANILSVNAQNFLNVGSSKLTQDVVAKILTQIQLIQQQIMLLQQQLDEVLKQTNQSDRQDQKLFCADGTINGQCSTVYKSKYCQGDSLVFNCSKCGCPNDGSVCSANGTCQGADACSDGTLEGQCSTTKPMYCMGGDLVWKCGTCGCPAGQSCIGNQCYANTNCSDGTASGQCSITKPKYCQTGNLIFNCSKCGCPNDGSACSANGTCQGADACSDGTLEGQCSTTKPMYCMGGDLVWKCGTCGCPAGQSCASGEICR